MLIGEEWRKVTPTSRSCGESEVHTGLPRGPTQRARLCPCQQVWAWQSSSREFAWGGAGGTQDAHVSLGATGDRTSGYPDHHLPQLNGAQFTSRQPSRGHTAVPAMQALRTGAGRRQSWGDQRGAGGNQETPQEALRLPHTRLPRCQATAAAPRSALKLTPAGERSEPVSSWDRAGIWGPRGISTSRKSRQPNF